LKKLLIVLSVCVVLIIAAGCSDKGAGDVVGTVNGENIYSGEYNYYFSDYFTDSYTNYYDYMLQSGYDLNDEDSSKEILGNLEKYVWDKVVENAIVREIATKDYKITLDDYYFFDALDYGHLNFIKDNLYYQKLTEAVKAELEADKKVTDEDIKAAYDKDTAKWNTRQVSHILIAISDPTNEEEVAAAKAKAEEIIKELASGKDFADLAKQYSDDTGSASEGGKLDVYFNSTGADPAGTTSFYTEFAAAAFKLEKVGDITQTPVLTDVGYHIIKLDGIHSDYKSVKDVIEESLRAVDDTTVSDAVSQKIAKAKDAAKIDMTMEFKYYTEEDTSSSSDSSSSTSDSSK